MITEQQYIEAKATLADIDARKDTVLQMYKIACRDYEFSIVDMERMKGCLADVLNDTFFEAEDAAREVIGSYENAQERTHINSERAALFVDAIRAYAKVAI